MLAVAIAVASGALAEDPACSPNEGSEAQVAELAAGDRLMLDDGREVRLAQVIVGAGRPDAGEEGQRIVAEARRAIAAAVEAAGGRVRIAGRGDPDRHGRIPALVWASGDGLLQAMLVDKGLARVSALPETPGCVRDLLRREAAARNAGSGLWSTSIGEIGQAARPSPIARDIGSFAIVEGRVLSVGERPRRTYLNFGTNWAEDFTAYVDARDSQRFQEVGIALGDLGGRHVRIRGWVLDDRGPAIQITHPGQLEIVD